MQRLAFLLIVSMAAAQYVELRPPTPYYSLSHFGFAVTTEDDMLFVGTPGWSTDKNDVGAVLVYKRDLHAGTIVLIDVLESPNPSASHRLGASIAVNGQSVFSGAPGLYVGRVILHRVFAEPGFQPAELLGNGASSEDQFGFAVAVAGDLYVASAPYNNAGGLHVSTGTVQLRVRNGGNTLTQGPTLSHPTLSSGQEFGKSIALSPDGSLLVVGSPGSNQAFVYHRNNTSTFVTAFLPPVELIPQEVGVSFGSSVAVCNSGNQIIVGAPDADVESSGASSGFITVFNLIGESWIAGDNIAASAAGGEESRFGASVACGDDDATILVGDSASHGRVYLLELATGIEIITVVTDDPDSEKLGTSVASWGDWFVAGAPNKDHVINTTTEVGFVGIWSTTESCEEDYEFTLGNGCVLCPAGTNSILGSPCSCANGEYLDRASGTCITCVGTSSSKPGASSASDCDCSGSSDPACGTSPADLQGLLPYILGGAGVLAAILGAIGVMWRRSSSSSTGSTGLSEDGTGVDGAGPAAAVHPRPTSRTSQRSGSAGRRKKSRKSKKSGKAGRRDVYVKSMGLESEKPSYLKSISLDDYADA